MRHPLIVGERNALALLATQMFETMPEPFCLHIVVPVVLLVVLTRRQTVDLRQYIAEIDPEAFLIFSDVTEVVGLGFKNWE